MRVIVHRSGDVTSLLPISVVYVVRTLVVLDHAEGHHHAGLPGAELEEPRRLLVLVLELEWGTKYESECDI